MRSKLSALAVPPVGDADMRGGGLAQPRLNSLVLRLENGQDVGLAEVRMPQGDVGGVDGAAEDLFGWSVTVSGGTSVIWARGDDDNGTNSGSAYVFTSSSTPPVTPQSAAQSAINFLLRK